MAGRRPIGHLVQEGKYKGYPKEDADDVVWAIGYSLPKLFSKKESTLETLATKCISENRVNIERLPAALRLEVNKFHYEYGVGTVGDRRYFSTSCHAHTGEARVEV